MPDQPQKIDVGDLTENITLAVQRAFQAQGAPALRPFGRGLSRCPRLV